MNQKPKIAIIGGGMAGLTLATQLANFATVELFEKARGLGGRMATRRSPPFQFDHGAQYFTVRTPEFSRFLHRLNNHHTFAIWRPRRLQFTPEQQITQDFQEPWYCCAPGMSAVSKLLSSHVKTHTNRRILAVTREHGRWTLLDDQHNHPGFDWVISTAPAPQSRQLLPAEFDQRDAFDKVQFEACFALLLGFRSPPSVDWDVAHIEGPILSWAAFNHSKPECSPVPALVVHANNTWSEQWLNDDIETVRQKLFKALTALFDWSAQDFKHSEVHRWRYAKTQKPLGRDYLMDTHLKLAACGDWCLGSRVESAFTSANALARELQNILR